MESKIIPLIKSKSGNLSDVNNYRAIAISTAISKLFESVIESYITSDRKADQYQFGFKKTTFYCTVHQCLKKTLLITTQLAEVMRFCALLIILKPLTKSTIGNCL